MQSPIGLDESSQTYEKRSPVGDSITNGLPDRSVMKYKVEEHSKNQPRKAEKWQTRMDRFDEKSPALLRIVSAGYAKDNKPVQAAAWEKYAKSLEI